MELNKIKSAKRLDKQLVELMYGDSVVGSSIIPTDKGDMTIEDMFNQSCDSKSHDKLRVKTHLKTLGVDNKYHEIDYIMRHYTVKQLFKICASDPLGEFELMVTEDHSLMIADIPCLTELHKTTPKDDVLGKYVYTQNEWMFITNVECCGSYNNFVYDIAIKTDNPNEHVFFANGILVHNTDSLYISYDNLINTIEGSDKWTKRQKVEFLVKLNEEFLNDHNTEVMKAHYESRNCHGPMAQLFELETVAPSGCWLNVKKRYSQLIMWKDGKYYDEDAMPLKVKGLEIIKGSYPRIARDILKKMTRLLLETDNNLLHTLNTKMQELKKDYMSADIEEICPTTSVNNYTKYIICDESTRNFQVTKGCPFAVRATAYYNAIINQYGLKTNLSYGGKHRWYVVKTGAKSKNSVDVYFAYEPGLCPDWAEKYAPIDKEAMFQRMVLDPFNRILEAISVTPLQSSGYIQNTLFDQLFA